MIRACAAALYIVAALAAPRAWAGVDAPNPALTPGAVGSADQSQVCASDGMPGSAYSRAHRRTTEAERRADFAKYGVPWSERRQYEDDHLVPLCLGGADTAANRWPQPRRGVWNSYEKDELERYACRAVCAGRLGLGEAQHWFLAPSDWRDPYRRIFGNPELSR